jgi:hypothetical protein
MTRVRITILDPADRVAFSDTLHQSFVTRTLHVHIVAFIPTHVAIY